MERVWVREWWKGKGIELMEGVMNGKEKDEIYRGRDRGKVRKREKRKEERGGEKGGTERGWEREMVC